MGATLEATHGRETAVFSSDVPSDKVHDLLPILDDILHPRIPEWEVRDEQPMVLEAAEKAHNDYKLRAFDLLHAVRYHQNSLCLLTFVLTLIQEAYRNRSLGISLYPSTSFLSNLSDETLLEFVEKNYGANSGRNSLYPIFLVLITL